MVVRSVESVFLQLYENIEVVVVDDGLYYLSLKLRMVSVELAS